MTSPQRKIVGTLHLIGRLRAWFNVGLVVRILVIPLSDAVIEIVVDKIVLDQRILKACEV